MSDAILQSLQHHFGFADLRPGQRQVIERLLSNRSAAAVFPTGGGKSMCYQLPALMLEGLTLVVSPLIALMKDQIDALEARNIAAARLDSTLGADEYRSVMQRARQGDLKLLYVAPERFANEMFRASMKQMRVALFAVDEAHCISEWGHNFRPDYLKLAGFARQYNAQRVLALTATATPRVLEDVCKAFEITADCAIRTGFYRPNLTLLLEPVDDPDARTDLLLEQLRSRPPGPTIVYVTTQRNAEELAAKLKSRGFDAAAYHAGMEDLNRSKVQERFLSSDRGIVVATIAFGMGIDKPDIRYVYHHNLPKSLENYSQEIGRAGRDGQPSICQLYACPDDLNVLENFIYGDTPGAAAVQSLIQTIFSQGEQFDVSQYELSSDCDIRVLVVRTLLTYLELEGYLEGGTPFYSSYRFKPLMSSKQILERFDPDRRQFLTRVLAQARKGRTWFNIDAAAAAVTLNEPRDRIVRALNYLGEQRMLELEAEGVRYRYRRLRMPEHPQKLAAELHRRTLKREENELARLQQVLDLVAMDECQVNALSRHFGDEMEQPCGHCTWCQRSSSAGKRIGKRPAVNGNLAENVKHAIAQVTAVDRSRLGSPLTLARFLCGIASPSISRARLGSHPSFGKLNHLPYQDVLKEIERSEAPR